VAARFVQPHDSYYKRIYVISYRTLVRSVLNGITQCYLPNTRCIRVSAELHLVIYMRCLQQQSLTVDKLLHFSPNVNLAGIQNVSFTVDHLTAR